MYETRLQQLIRVPSVSRQEEDRPFPECRRVLETLFPRVFSTCTVEDFDGSLLLRWQGKDPAREPILFMNHHDVVAAPGEWEHDPFSGDIADGKLWGRGTLDTKGGLFCMLQAAEELIRDRFVPEQDVYFESAATEETTGNGADRISRALQERGIHFAFCLDEGGMILENPLGNAPGWYAMVGMGEKGCADLKFIARSRGGHASMPGKDTPLLRLAKFMLAVEKDESLFPVELSDTVAEMFRRMAPATSGALRGVFAHPLLSRQLIERTVPALSPSGNALMRTTLAFTAAHGSDTQNALPDEAYVTGNMRFSHHQGGEASIRAVTELAAKFDVETVVLDPGFSSPVTPYDSAPFRLLELAVSRVFPGVVTSPYLCTGASDARFFTRVCDHCMRFLPFRISDEQLASIHGHNENVDVSALEPAVRFYQFMMGDTRYDK